MPRYILHVGPHKTGSTYLQTSFARLRAELGASGILYPGPPLGGSSHPALAVMLKANAKHELQEVFAQIKAEAAETVLLSAEDLAAVGREGLELLRSMIGPAPVRVVFYLRRWSELIRSRWQEEVKHGSIQTLPEYCAAASQDALRLRYINHDIVLRRFSEVFGPDSLTLISYSNLVDCGVDLLEHFFREVLHWQQHPGRVANVANVSLSPVDCEFLRLVNVLDQSRPARPPPELLKLYARAKQQAPGPVAAIIAAMQSDKGVLAIDDNSPCFNAIYRQLEARYGRYLIGTEHGTLLFDRRRNQADYIRQNYLLHPGVREQIRAVERILHEEVPRAAAHRT